ncbi:hypothetical protein DSO57_1004632 [Entomophthora muscae]|uniref:Uncharacterized protein n=1 Tax=Entomophthora muscae TaxID=34485 RepID=A0ACC2SL08_9FUNG|nr:hypothetical protein DSO57_1004632 [Entomophthora muscae]
MHMLNHSPQDSSGGIVSTGIDPSYQMAFKQVFDPAPSTVAAFLAIYEAVMRHTPDELK